MNPGGLALLVVISAVALVARGSLRGAAGPLAAFQRRALLVLAVALPLTGLVLPHVPWKAAAIGLVLGLAIAVEVVLRAFDRHESAAERGDRG
jgi:Na+-driven multidrug efflux pump